MGPVSLTIDEVHESVRRHESRGRALLYAFAGKLDVEDEAEGPFVRGASGTRYVDWGGYSVFLLGHSPPDVVEAVIEQLLRLPTSSRSFPHSPTAWFHREMAMTAPEGLGKFMLFMSGTEAVEAGLKLARAATGRSEIFYLEKAYHGKTLGALSVTDASLFRGTIRELDLGTLCVSRTDSDSVCSKILAARPAALILEPIQGEGGIFCLEAEYLRAVRKACDEAGSLLICDEIQCGLGRSGRLWAHEVANIRPDILLAGKALGGGVIPVSAMIATQQAFEPFDRDPTLHSSTFGGNPVSAAAAAATLRIVRESGFSLRCAELGAELQGFFERMAGRHPGLIAAVSGSGLLLGLHFRTGEAAAIFYQKCLEERLLLTPCLTTPSVIRVSPPATMEREDLDFGAAAIERALGATASELDEVREEHLHACC